MSETRRTVSEPDVPIELRPRKPRWLADAFGFQVFVLPRLLGERDLDFLMVLDA
jgi:hypothetical protein